MRTLLLATVGALSGSLALAQTTVVGQINAIRTGPKADAFTIQVNAPQVNPARCPNSDGYTTEATFPGYRTFYSAVLTAFTVNSSVQVIVHNDECFGGRPKLIGINLTR